MRADFRFAGKPGGLDGASEVKFKLSVKLSDDNIGL
jgi:hypothetical protein